MLGLQPHEEAIVLSLLPLFLVISELVHRTLGAGHKISSLPIRLPTWVRVARSIEDSTQSSAHWGNEARLQSVSLSAVSVMSD